jgi:hypothetical protein
MVRQAQLIYCVFITGYMFRPIYRSSSGLFNKRVRNCYAWWDPIMFIKIKYVKYIKCLFLEGWECRTYAVEFCVVLYLDDANSNVVVFCCF